METSPDALVDDPDLAQVLHAIWKTKLHWEEMRPILSALADGRRAKLSTEVEKVFYLELMSLFASHCRSPRLMLEHAVMPNVGLDDDESYTAVEGGELSLESEMICDD